MYSFYVVQHRAMVNNNDTTVDRYVLSDRDDLIRVLTELDVDPRFIDIPELPGRPLPPGHPVLLDGEPLHYGCTAFYN